MKFLILSLIVLSTCFFASSCTLNIKPLMPTPEVTEAHWEVPE